MFKIKKSNQLNEFILVYIDKFINFQVRGNRDGFTKFVRKGTVGDHVNHLTKEQIKIFDDVMNTKGKRLGIDHLWKN